MSDLQEDNLYPQNGAYYAKEPVEQVAERDQERDSVLAHAPQIQDAIKSLNERADFYNSTSSISADLQTDPDKFMHEYSAHQKASAILRMEAMKLEGTLEAYLEE